MDLGIRDFWPSLCGPRSNLQELRLGYRNLEPGLYGPKLMPKSVRDPRTGVREARLGTMVPVPKSLASNSECLFNKIKASFPFQKTKNNFQFIFRFEQNIKKYYHFLKNNILENIFQKCQTFREVSLYKQLMVHSVNMALNIMLVVCSLF